jgi:hypothetical protein
MTSFRTPTHFSFLNKENYFSPHIAECANIAENYQYRRNFLEKTFSYIRPLYTNSKLKVQFKILDSDWFKFFQSLSKLNSKNFKKRFIFIITAEFHFECTNIVWHFSIIIVHTISYSSWVMSHDFISINERSKKHR